MAQKVVDQLQLDIKPKELLGQVAVNPDEADYIISIEAKDRNQNNPQRIVQKFAELFVQQRQIANLEVNQSDRILTSIVDSAAPPDIFSPKTSINMLAGGVLGAMLGVIILFVLEWIESDVVRSGEDVERFIGVPVIGAIPTISTREASPAAAAGQRPALGRRA
jgi:capsular polysaccharide biosynthesis protein